MKLVALNFVFALIVIMGFFFSIFRYTQNVY